MLADGHEPRFDRDYAYGHQGELIIENMLEGLANGQVRADYKRKSQRDDTFFVEFEHDPGRTGRYVRSGLGVTTADVWAYLIADTGIVVVVPVPRLRQLAKLVAPTPAGINGSCPTHGYLAKLDLLTQHFCDPKVEP